MQQQIEKFNNGLVKYNEIFEYQKFRQSVICSTEIFDQLNL